MAINSFLVTLEGFELSKVCHTKTLRILFLSEKIPLK